MQYRILGRTGLRVSALGLGGGGLGHIFGHTTDAEAQATVHAALDAGINYFDVAPAYGGGRAEENLGRALDGHRHDAVIATKILLQPADLTDIPAAVERSVSKSLERLRTDRIDVFQLHNMVSREPGSVTQVTVTGEPRRSLGLDHVLGAHGVAEAFRRLKATEAIRFVGFTGVGEAAAIREVMRSGAFDTVQAYYHLLNRSAAQPLPPGSTLHDHGQIIPLAAELGLGVIGIRNLAAGALTGGFDRSVDPDSLHGRDARRAQCLDFLTADRTPLAQLAARFVIGNPQVATVIPGAKNRAELRGAVQGAALPPISDDHFARLDALAADDFGLPEPGDTPQ